MRTDIQQIKLRRVCGEGRVGGWGVGGEGEGVREGVQFLFQFEIEIGEGREGEEGGRGSDTVYHVFQIL